MWRDISHERPFTLNVWIGEGMPARGNIIMPEGMEYDYEKPLESQDQRDFEDLADDETKYVEDLPLLTHAEQRYWNTERPLREDLHVSEEEKSREEAEEAGTVHGEEQTILEEGYCMAEKEDREDIRDSKESGSERKDREEDMYHPALPR